MYPIWLVDRAGELLGGESLVGSRVNTEAPAGVPNRCELGTRTLFADSGLVSQIPAWFPLYLEIAFPGGDRKVKPPTNVLCPFGVLLSYMAGKGGTLR